MKYLLTLLMITGSYISSIAQDYKVTTGVVYYNEQSFEDALENFNEALKNPEGLKEKNLVKAYYYRGKTVFALINKYILESDEEKLKSQQFSYLSVYNDYIAAKKYDKSGDYEEKISDDLSLISGRLLQVALSYLNEGNKSSGSDKQSYLEEAIKYSNAALEAKTNLEYMAYDIRGQSLLGSGKLEDALSDFQKSDSLYQLNKPDNPDLLMAYTYYRQALIYKYQNELAKALDALNSGKEFLAVEWERTEKQKENYETGEWEKLENQYNSAKNDINLLELDIYINYPEKRNEAIEKLREAVLADPEDYDIRIAYAQMFEKEDIEKAIKHYNEAIRIDPNKETAYFNIGVLYYNQAAKMLQGTENATSEEYEQISSKAKTLMRNAMPYFEKAYAIKPDEQCKGVLKQIYIQLDEMDKYTKLKSE